LRRIVDLRAFEQSGHGIPINRKLQVANGLLGAGWKDTYRYLDAAIVDPNDAVHRVGLGRVDSAHVESPSFLGTIL
jgi:hypothetical protein